MKFAATALVAALSFGTGLASVIQLPLRARELPRSTSLLHARELPSSPLLLQRRSPLDDMDPFDALRLVLLRRVAAGAPPPKTGGEKSSPQGKGQGAGGAERSSPQGKGQGATPGGKEEGKAAGGGKKKEEPWVPPQVHGDVDKNTLKCNPRTHECSGEIIVG